MTLRFASNRTATRWWSRLADAIRSERARPWLALSAIVGAYLIVGELVRAIDRWSWSALPARSRWGGIPLYALWIVVLGLVAIRRPRPQLWPTRATWTRANVAVLACVVVATDWIYGWKVPSVLAGTLEPSWPPSNWVYFANAVAFAPWVEEWLFRGVLWDAIASRARARDDRRAVLADLRAIRRMALVLDPRSVLDGRRGQPAVGALRVRTRHGDPALAAARDRNQRGDSRCMERVVSSVGVDSRQCHVPR